MGLGEERRMSWRGRRERNPGTGIVHALLSTSQLMVVTLRLPRKRPSTVKSRPRV